MIFMFPFGGSPGRLFAIVLGVFVVVVVAAIFWAGFVGYHRHQAAWEAFNDECLADGLKQYECTAMWRVGRRR